jgi:hypothetical protein
LLLVHQLPLKPAYFLVKIWHRLQGPGVVSVKISVYGLPTSEQAREDFHCVLNEIERGGGEGMIYEAGWLERPARARPIRRGARGRPRAAHQGAPRPARAHEGLRPAEGGVGDRAATR